LPSTRFDNLRTILTRLVRAIQDEDEALVEDAVTSLAKRGRLYAPLGMVVGAFLMLFQGLVLLFKNWRLLLIQILPAMWIWLAMLDLKVHAFKDRPFVHLSITELFLGITAVTLITAAAFFLNAVFAFSIARKGKPDIKAGFAAAKKHALAVLTSGVVVGLALGISAIYLDRLGPYWFGISMSIVIGIMMVTYVALPARLAGIKSNQSFKEKAKTSAVGGTLGAVICAPPYALARVGILMLGVKALVIPGVIILIIGITLQVGATSSVKAVKMSAKLVSAARPV